MGGIVHIWLGRVLWEVFNNLLYIFSSRFDQYTASIKGFGSLFLAKLVTIATFPSGNNKSEVFATEPTIFAEASKTKVKHSPTGQQGFIISLINLSFRICLKLLSFLSRLLQRLSFSNIRCPFLSARLDVREILFKACVFFRDRHFIGIHIGSPFSQCRVTNAANGRMKGTL